MRIQFEDVKKLDKNFVKKEVLPLVLRLGVLAVLFTVENGGVLIMSALYATFLFKEKLTAPKIIGLVIAVISMALLGYATA